MDLFRDTAFGRLTNLVTGGKLFAYDDGNHPFTKQFSSESSLNDDHQHPGAKEGQTLEPATLHDPEKSSDRLLVEWSSNDPQNPRNWSTPKKLFVTFLICLLTTSVYIGSAIYTAGLLGIQEQFHVSPVKALLGLTLFVLGYALGPMVWVCIPHLLPAPCTIRDNLEFH